MFNILKQKAITYFADNHDMQAAFRNCKDQKAKRSFYMLLIAHYSEQPDQIIKVISNLKSQDLLVDKDFLNVVWSLALQVSGCKDIVKKLSSIISIINSKSIIQKSTLMEYLPDSIINQSGLMEQQQIDKKTQRIYTKINYEQHKFSLLKQNNQGYAKLLLLLINLSDSYETQEVWTKVLALVGNFDLDPDRVLDLIIQAKLQKDSIQIYGALIKKFKRQSITVIVGNRLTKKSSELRKTLIFAGYVQNFSKITIQQIYKKDGQISNPALIQLCANLIRQNIIKLSDLDIYLQPSDTILQQINYKRLKNGEQKIMKSFKMSLQEIDEKQKIKLFFEDNLKFMGQLLHSTKLALYCQFLKQNNWKQFKQCWQPYEGKFDLLLYQPIMNNILALMEWTIEPLYQKISFARFFKQKRQQKICFPKNQNGFHQFNEVTQQLFMTLKELFTYIDVYIGFNHSLFAKMCRLFKNLIKGNLEPHIKMIQSQLEENMKFIIKNYIIPGISYDKNNPTLGIEAYEVLQLFDYRFRYECYLQVYTNKMTHNPYVAKFFQHVKNKQNVIVNNLSKDNKKLFVKKLAKLTHNHALQVLYWIIRRLLMADYEAVVPEIVSALNNCTPMTLQMAMFLMIFYLNEQKEPSVNSKTRQFQPWFKNIITFISLFYRKYLEVDIQPVFDYIIVKIGEPVRQLEDNGQMPGALLKLLHELLNKMFGTFMNQDVNKKQFQILATGHRLQSQMLYLTSQIRAAKKSKHILQKFFWTESVEHHNGFSLAFNMLVLLTQKRAQLIHKSYIEDIKIIGDIFDEYTVLIIQLVRVLTYQSLDFQHYKRLLPNNALHILLNIYKLPMQIAFEITRPATKAVGLMTKQEWIQTTEQINKTLEVYLKQKQNLIEGHSESHDQIYQILNTIKSNLKENISIGFFSTFWLLSLDSIYFPAKLYTQKIDDLKKKIQGVGVAKKDRNDRDVEKNKTLFQKILKEEQVQKKKASITLTQENLKKLEVDSLKTGTSIDLFAQKFVQICLLPRMLLDPKEALYGIKFVIETIKANKMTSSKSIKFLTLIIEFVNNYLPHATFRQSTNCLSIFLSQILGIFINWNDVTKLKQDLKKYLGIEDIKESNYQKLKQYILKLFQRVGKLIITIKDEPYMIKNCLYLLQKVDAIPGYKQQAEELEQHLKEIKQKYSNQQDMQTICDRQIVILNMKKDELPDKSSQPAVIANTQTPQPVSQQIINVVPAPVQTKNSQPSSYPRVSPIKQAQKSFKKDKSPLPNRQSRDKQDKYKKDQKNSSNNNKTEDKYAKKSPIPERKQDKYQNDDKFRKSVDKNDKQKKIQQDKNSKNNKNSQQTKSQITSSKMAQQNKISKPQSHPSSQMISENSVMTFSNIPILQEPQRYKQAILPPLRTVKQMKELQLKRKNSQIASKTQVQSQSQAPDNNTKIMQKQVNPTKIYQSNKSQNYQEVNSSSKDGDKHKSSQKDKPNNDKPNNDQLNNDKLNNDKPNSEMLNTQKVPIKAQIQQIVPDHLPSPSPIQTQTQMKEQNNQVLQTSRQIKQLDKKQQNKGNSNNICSPNKLRNSQSDNNKQDNNQQSQIPKQSPVRKNTQNQIKPIEQENSKPSKQAQSRLTQNNSTKVQKDTLLQKDSDKNKNKDKETVQDKGKGIIDNQKDLEKESKAHFDSNKSQIQISISKPIQHKQKDKNRISQHKQKSRQGGIQVIMKMSLDKDRKSQYKETKQHNRNSQNRESRWGNQANKQSSAQDSFRHNGDFKEYKDYNKDYKEDKDKSPRNQDRHRKEDKYNRKQEKSIHKQDKYRHNKQDKYPIKQEKYDKYQDNRDYKKSKEKEKDRKKSKDRDSRDKDQWKKERNYDKYDTEKPKDRDQGRYEKRNRSRSRDKHRR